MSVSACINITPQENLQEELIRGVAGRDFSDAPQYLKQRKPFSRQLLANGNVELRYVYLRSCNFVVEVGGRAAQDCAYHD